MRGTLVGTCLKYAYKTSFGSCSRLARVCSLGVGVEDSMDSKEEEEGSDSGGFGSVPGSSLTSYHGICVRITTHNYN